MRFNAVFRALFQPAHSSMESVGEPPGLGNVLFLSSNKSVCLSAFVENSLKPRLSEHAHIDVVDQSRKNTDRMAVRASGSRSQWEECTCER